MGKQGTPTQYPRTYSNKIYRAWKNMRNRCNCISSPDYKYYGGRDIKHCTEWANYANFEAWALQNGYSDNLTLDRVDVNGNYNPQNCRWADRTVQARNTRKLRKDNTTGERGVTRHGNKYQAEIAINGKKRYLGLYETTKDAAIAFDKYVIHNNLEHTRNYL